MNTTPTQVTTDAVTIQVAPSDYVAHKQSVIDGANEDISTLQSEEDNANAIIAQQTKNVSDIQSAIASKQAIVVATQADIDAVTKVVPELAQSVAPAQQDIQEDSQTIQ